MSFASQVRVTTEHDYAQNMGYLIKTLVLTGPKSSWFISLCSQQDQTLHYGPNRTKYLYFIMVTTGPKTSLWSLQDQRPLFHYGPNRTKKASMWLNYRTVTKWSQCDQNIMVHWLFLLVLWFMTWQRCILLLVLLFFQKFINELPFFFSQDYFPTVSYVLISSWFINWFFHLVRNLFCNLLCYAVFLGPPFLLLLVSTLYVETSSLLCVALNCFVLLPVMWVLTSLAVATFWVRFASLVFPIYNIFTFVMSLWLLHTR